MSYVLKTVRVKTDAKDNPHGFYEINETDFDSKVHELYVEKSAEAKKPEEKKADKK